MSAKWQYLYGLDSQDPKDGPFGCKSVKLPNITTANLSVAAAAYEGNIVYDTTTNTVKYCDGSNWQEISITAGVGTLQQVTNAGKTSSITAIEFTGANSSANAVLIGDGTRKLQLYTDGTDSFIGTASGDLKLVPNGSDVRITGNIIVSGTQNITGASTLGSVSASSVAVTGAFSAGSFNVDAVSSSTAGSALSLDGNGAGGVTLGTTSTGNIALQRNITTAASRSLTMAGVGGSDILTLTAGDAVLSDGSLTITDADNATSFSLTNNSYLTGGLVVLRGSGIITGNVIDVVTNNLSSGTMLYLETSAAGFTGKYIQCYDGGADDFSVGLYGATIIAGNAAGTAALTVSAGDFKLTAGVIDQDIITDHANVFTRAQGTTTADFFQILCTNASDDECALYVKHSGTGAIPAVEIVGSGTAVGALKITSDKTDGGCLELLNKVSATVSSLVVDGSTADWLGATNVGLAHIKCDGALAHANASCLYIGYSGAGAATGLGTSLRIVDTGSTASSYAAYISAATGEALKVDIGKSVFDEGVLVGDGGIGYVSSNGAQDLVLQTNEGTNSSKITITDAASGDITLDCDTNGSVRIPGPATHASNTQRYTPFIVRKNWSHADPDGNNDLTVFSANSPKLVVIDAWLDMTTAEGGAMTVTLRDTAAGAGNAITNAIDANVTTLSRATTLSTVALAANSSVFANFSGNPGTAVGVLYISCIEVE